MINPALISMSFDILSYVRGFPHIFMTGMEGKPCGAPRPVEKSMNWAPVAAIPVKISGSLPVV